MGKFNFELESVLNIRRQFEDKAKNELSIEIKKLNEKLDDLRREVAYKQSCLNKIKKAQQGTVNIVQIKEYSTYIQYIDDEIKSLNNAIKEQKDVVDKYRERLLEISKKKKILEKLREKKLVSFLTEQRKEEDKLSDEIVSYKHFDK